MAFNPDNFNIFPNINFTAVIDSISITTGGSLLSGTYFICLAYKKNIVTDYFYISNPINIYLSDKNESNFSGSSGNISTSKSISLEISNLDTSYNELVISVIHYANEVLQPVITLPEFAIVNTSIQVVINDLTSGTFGSLDDIVIDNPFYNKAKGIKFADNSLYLANLSSQEDLGFQKYANNIKVKGVTKTLTDAVTEKNIDITSSIDHDKLFGDETFLLENTNSFKNEENIIYNKSFRRGEVYALYISLILKNGSRTKAYHIPGRSFVNFETASVDNNLGFENELRFQTEATAELDILNNTNNKFELCYWQNKNEFYPTTSDFEIWNNVGYTGINLTGNVRHHRIPEVINKTDSTNEFFEDKIYTTYDEASKGFNIIGLKFEDIYIPPDIKAQISGYELFYAKKTDSNRLMLGQGLVLPTELENVGAKVLLTNTILSPGYSEQVPCSYKINQVDTNVNMIIFDMLINNSKLNKVNYLSNLYNVTEKRHWKAYKNATSQTITAANFYSGAGVTGGTSIISFINPGEWTKLNTGNSTKKLRKVKGKSFIPSFTENVLIQQLGFPSNFNNAKGLNTILLNVELFNNAPIVAHDLSATPEGSNSDLGYIYLSNLCSYKEDVHNPFQIDELISLHVSTDIPKTDITFTTSDIYNGDTFINLFYYRYNAATFGLERTDLNLLVCVVESESNISTRLIGDKVEDTFYPAFADPLKFIEYNTTTEAENKFWYQYDNYFAYNTDYSKVNNIKQYGIFNTLKLKEDSTELPNRIIRSDIISNSDEFRIFRPLNFLDMERSRGEIVKIDNYNNTLLIHCQRGLFKTKGKATLITSEQDVYAGSGDILQQQPDEFVITPFGYGGLQDPRHSMVTKYGYFFVDNEDKRVFLLSNVLEELSSRKYGMHKYFRNVTNYKTICFDPKYDRFLVSTDKETVSFDSNFESWISFHDFNPQYMFYSLQTFYSIFEGDVYQHHTGKYGEFYNTKNPYKISVVVNENPTVSKQLQSIEIIGEIALNNKIKGTVRIHNDYQDTGEIDLIYFKSKGNIRRIQRSWTFNRFRDLINPTTRLLDTNLEWYKKKHLVDKYHIITFTFSNDSASSVTEYHNYLISLNDIKSNFKVITR